MPGTSCQTRSTEASMPSGKRIPPPGVSYQVRRGRRSGAPAGRASSTRHRPATGPSPRGVEGRHTGCCSGQAASAVGRRGPLPQSTRTAWASDETGFHSAITRSPEGMLLVRRERVGDERQREHHGEHESLDRLDRAQHEPTQMPSQIIAKPNTSSRREREHARRARWRTRHPIRSPVTDITTMPMLECTRLETLRPIRTAAEKSAATASGRRCPCRGRR